MKNKHKQVLIYSILFLIFISLSQSCRTRTDKGKDTSCYEVVEYPDFKESDRGKWFEGYYTDTSTCTPRNYMIVLSKHSIESLESARVIEELYPRSHQEFDCFYDSLRLSEGDRKLFFYKMNTLFVKYAISDSSGCFQRLLNMTKYIDPRTVDDKWLTELALNIYYYVIPENLENFKMFFDTCIRESYYGMSEWVEAYNNRIIYTANQ